MNRFLLDEMARRSRPDREYPGLLAGMSRRARRDFLRARAAFAGRQAGVIVSSGDTSRGRSPAIWSRIEQILGSFPGDLSLGGMTGDDFTSFGGTVATNVGTYASTGGAYLSREDASCSIKQSNTQGPTTSTGPFGVIDLQTAASAANLTCGLEAGYGNGGSFELVSGNLPSRLAFECRFQIDQIAGNDLFVGLMEKGVASSDHGFFTTGDALATKSFIGGYWLTAAAGTLLANAGKNGQTALTSPGSQAIVASTWYKFGFLYDTTIPGTNNLNFYANGVLLGGFAVSTSNFPTGKVLTPAFIVQNDATGTNANNLLLDWWYGAQVFQG